MLTEVTTQGNEMWFDLGTAFSYVGHVHSTWKVAHSTGLEVLDTDHSLHADVTYFLVFNITSSTMAKLHMIVYF